MRKPTIASILQHILVTTIATTTLVACGDSGIDTDGYGAHACKQLSLAALSPTTPLDYFEFRARDLPHFDPDAQWETTIKSGTPCANATNRAACEAALAAPYDGSGFTTGSCGGSCGEFIMVINHGDEVKVLGTTEAVKEMLGAIDTPAEARMVTRHAGYDMSCENVEDGGTRAVDGGYEVIATGKEGGCGTTTRLRYRLSVNSEGTVRELESEVIESYDSDCY